jgi:anti-sigma factor RsiW
MSNCLEIRPKIQFYVDGELTGDEQEALFSHLELCEDCRTALEEAENLALTIRAARPDVKAPVALRQRLLQTMAAEEGKRAPQQNVGSKLVFPKRPVWRLWSVATIAAMLALMVGGALLLRMRQKDQAVAMVRMAIQAHHDLQQNQVPLDISTDSPKAVSDWFGTRVNFPFRMANAGIASDDRAKYRLAGGRLMTVHSEHVALLSFRLPDETVSLLVGPGAFAANLRGTTIHSDGIALHAHDEDSLHVVTWQNRGLSYVLVSGTSMGNQSKCVRCHEAGPAHTMDHEEVSRSSGLLSKLHSEFPVAIADARTTVPPGSGR